LKSSAAFLKVTRRYRRAALWCSAVDTPLEAVGGGVYYL
jgi:hypothetical protein